MYTIDTSPNSLHRMFFTECAEQRRDLQASCPAALISLSNIYCICLITGTQILASFSPYTYLYVAGRFYFFKCRVYSVCFTLSMLRYTILRLDAIPLARLLCPDFQSAREKRAFWGYIGFLVLLKNITDFTSR